MEPSLEITVPLPEDKVSIPSKRQIFPQYQLFTSYGENMRGKGYIAKIALNMNINNYLESSVLHLDEKTSVGLNFGIRDLNENSTLDLHLSTKNYKIEDVWRSLFLADYSLSIYKANTLLKLMVKGYYESSTRIEATTLLGRKFFNRAFIESGISCLSADRNIASFFPYLSANIKILSSVFLRILYTSKEITTPLEQIYMNQKYILQNPNLKMPKEKLFDACLRIPIVGDSIILGLRVKEVENWIQLSPNWGEDFIVPLNIAQTRDDHNFYFRLSKSIGRLGTNIEFDYYKYSKKVFYKPNFLLSFNFLTPIFQGFNISTQGTLIGEREYLYDLFPSFWLFSIGLLKEFKYLQTWLKVENIFNEKYEIIEGRNGTGISVCFGLNLNK